MLRLDRRVARGEAREKYATPIRNVAKIQFCKPRECFFRLARCRTLKARHKMSIWTILFVVLLIAWITGFTVFHVAGGLIHLLLLFAVISLVVHFVMGRRAA